MSAIVAVVFHDNVLVLGVAAVLSLVFAGFALLAPVVLRPLNFLWFRFSLLVSKVMNPVILGLMFMVAIVPVGLIMRLMRDPLRSRRTGEPSYWIKRAPIDPEINSMTNQF